ncbi:MarR family winged helix-turn-helix transcriptional regulator [Lichenifustis flavocetrariae]|uniref:MarR family transcriptional regulator n=1 Tax=Lichenifustis flavocetrariae TaxID=2949735 RepID=A0AA42CLB1_9HYPH|nr:MarR family transcriptional regulator [Lichenifustis flavocetrariae]MCW6507202.1 MarR family transcriptional regulator [Lichenifustis flavocetrariae]
MPRTNACATSVEPAYVLDRQIGFLLRQVAQRHALIFAAGVEGEVTATQWAALAKLYEVGALSQNRLGRLTVMDAATVKGVIDRLSQRELTETRPDPEDGRRIIVELTVAGRTLVERLIPQALAITDETLAPLTSEERQLLWELLTRLR